MIPKIIHYCWVGGGPIPKKDLKCIESWKKFCPDYKIIRWDESNYDFTKNKYMSQAYDAKVWGFVPDYARLDIIYEYGGIYLDTDVELIKPLDDLLGLDAFFGFECGGLIAPGLGFGATQKNPFIKEMKDAIYDNRVFIDDDGKADLTASTIFSTEFFKDKGLILNGKTQMLKGGLEVFAQDYFCPCDMYTGTTKITANTYSIHWYNASWKPLIYRLIKAVRWAFIKRFDEGKWQSIKKKFSFLIKSDDIED